MVAFLLFCVFFWAGTFAQEQAGKQVTFKAICGDGTERCTVKEDCSLSIYVMVKRIQVIDDQALAGCAEIERLFLERNEISEISKNAFQDQQNLQNLFLGDNQIKKLTPGVFDPLTNLTLLGLERNLIEVIDDSLFAKNLKLDRLWLEENKIVAVGPNAFQHLIHLKELRLFGNPCMHPNVKSWPNPQNLGVFSSEDYGKWSNEKNECVSEYDVQKCFNKFNIERQDLRQNLTDAEKTASLVTSIIIILLLIIVIVESVVIWKLKREKADQKDQIIRLDRLASSQLDFFL
jgi:Leucine-rich repeat (LRR) protein